MDAGRERDPRQDQRAQQHRPRGSHARAAHWGLLSSRSAPACAGATQTFYTSLQSLDISKRDDINVEATGTVTVIAGANVFLGSEGDLHLKYVQAGDKLYVATGLGAFISRATNAGDFPKLSAAVLVMAVIVVGINRTLWKRLQNFANERCRFIT